MVGLLPSIVLFISQTLGIRGTPNKKLGSWAYEEEKYSVADIADVLWK